MIETAKDVFYLVFAFCVLWFTIFVCWAIYYIAMILKETKNMMADVRKKIELIESVLISFKERLEHTSSHMKLLVDTAVNVAEFIKDRKSDKKTTRKKKK